MKAVKSLILTWVLLVSLTPNTHSQTFICDSNLYQVTDGKDLKVLDPVTGTYQLVGSSSLSYNGAGYNTEDDYIYGIGSGETLLRIDNTGEATNLGEISNFTAYTYTGDIDTLGNWFSFYEDADGWYMNRVDVSTIPPAAELFSVTELSGVANATKANDMAFNPLTQKYYGMQAGKLMEFDPYNLTVQTIANYSSTADAGGYGAAWSDSEGNTYFFNNNTGNIYRAVFDSEGTITSFAFIATSEPNGNNDGMSCSLAGPPSFPEICGNGIDDDLDGLTDCEDSDCYLTEDCGITAEIVHTDFACSESIATFHTFFTNNSNLANAVTVSGTLPAGFEFLQDTLEFDQGGFADFTKQPTEGDTGLIEWGDLTLEPGETVRISYDVSFDQLSLTDGDHSTVFTASLSTAGSQLFPSSSLNVSTTTSSCPAPEEYVCEPAFYQVYKKAGKNQPNMYGKLDPITGDYDPIAVASDYANGLGFDVNTGLVYGASGKRFIELDADGLVIDKGIRFNHNVYRGDINESSEWYGVDGSDLVKVDVSGTPTVVNTYGGQGLSGWDIAYNEDGHFYSVHNTTVQRFNTTTNQKETVGTITGAGIPASGGYGAQWTGDDGYLYASHNSTGKILRINVETLQARVVSSSIDGLSKNDGFSCPMSIPAIFEFDYGDNSKLPQSRILSYHQDLETDDIPDYSTVWIGNTVSYDTTDPSNATADGDLDDGFDISTEIQNDRVSYALGLNSNQSATAYCLIGLDWNNNGQFDQVITTDQELEGASTLLGEIIVPEGYAEGTLNARVIVSESDLDSANIVGDILQMGEVEDYTFELTTACQSCEVTSANLGGLESNGSLAMAIAKRNFRRSLSNEHKELKVNQPLLSSYQAARLSDPQKIYFPQSGVNGTEEVTISTPEDLIEITNATHVVSADYYDKERRIAAALFLETNGAVYDHAKNICDRLNDKSIEDIKVMNLDGYKIITAKIKDRYDVVEYSTWFGLRKEADGYALESLWNVDHYPEGDYLNFQVWGASVSQVYYITREIIRNVGDVQLNEQLHQLPEVFVKSGKYENGRLLLSIENRAGVKEAVLDYNKRITEQSPEEWESMGVVLTGARNQNLEVETGYLFDAGISLRTSITSAYDVLYLADGAWGTDLNEDMGRISRFEVVPVQEEEFNGHLVERGFLLEAESEDVVNVFRNMLAGERSLGIAPFATLSFEVESNVPLEVVLVEQGLENWDDRLRTTIARNPEKAKVTVQLNDFEKFDPDRDYEIQTLVFSYINSTGRAENISVELNGVVFGADQILSAEASNEIGIGFTIYPNPARGEVNVSVDVATEQSYVLNLIDFSGKLVSTTSGRLSSGNNQIGFHRVNNKSGVYFLQLQLENGEKQTRKIVFKD